MRLLLDTHVPIWWNSQSPELPASFARSIREPRNAVFVSAATVWEIVLKQRLGKLRFTGDVIGAVRGFRFDFLPITEVHAQALGTLPPLHGDPFDRMLVVQSHEEDLVLLTVDEQVLAYKPRTLARS